MTSLFNTKLQKNLRLSIPKNNAPIRLSKHEIINKSLNNKKNLTFNHFDKYQLSQGLSTQRYTLQNDNNDVKTTEYDTVLTLPSLDFIDFNKDKAHNTFNKTISKSSQKASKTRSAIRTKAYKILNDPKYFNNSMSTFKYYNNNFRKKSKEEKFRGVPREFMEAMRLDLTSNIIKANKYMISEKERLIKVNPKLKYYFHCNNINKIKKEKEMKRASEIRLIKEYGYKKKIVKEEQKLNDYYIDLLLKENEQHFYINKPMIDKNKFSQKFILYKNNSEEKKEIPNRNVRNIFSTILCDKFYKSQKIEKVQLTKNLLYKRFIGSLKKSVIEFKNIIIPFNDYVEYYKKSQNLSELVKNEYMHLIELIKRENKEIYVKDKAVCKFLEENKICSFVVDINKQSVLIVIVKNKLYKSISKIIDLGCNVNFQDFKGRTALHFAVKNKDLTAVTILLYYLANPLIKDNIGKLPIDYLPQPKPEDKIIYEDKKIDENNIIKELLCRSSVIRKFNKYRSWKEFDVYIRRGIQYYLYKTLPEDKYEKIFFYIENPIFYYVNKKTLFLNYNFNFN